MMSDGYIQLFHEQRTSHLHCQCKLGERRSSMTYSPSVLTMTSNKEINTLTDLQSENINFSVYHYAVNSGNDDVFVTFENVRKTTA